MRPMRIALLTISHSLLGRIQFCQAIFFCKLKTAQITKYDYFLVFLQKSPLAGRNGGRTMGFPVSGKERRMCQIDAKLHFSVILIVAIGRQYPNHFFTFSHIFSLAAVHRLPDKLFRRHSLDTCNLIEFPSKHELS